MHNNNALIERYKNIRLYTETNCAPLAIEDYVAQASPEVSPPKWNLAHTSWFFETFILQPYSIGYSLFNPQYPFLFNSYYNHAGDRIQRHRRGDLTRPTVAEVLAYRKYVDEAMCSFMLEDDGENPDWKSLLELGLQHEQQHQELFWTDLTYTFGLNPLFPVYAPVLPFRDDLKVDKPLDFISMDEGIYEIGHRGSGFSFDNEMNAHKVYLHDFQIADRLISNGEYFEFMEDGGYENFNLWHDEAWKWVNENQLHAPLYWHKREGKWMHYSLSGLKEVHPDELLKHISHYEAFAFAAWKGMRLPTEFEWEAACNRFEWGQRWEHTASAYLPYPGFKKAAGAVGEYSGKFMISQMVLRGASAATSPGHQRTTYRNFFHPWMRWQYAGIRLAR